MEKSYRYIMHEQDETNEGGISLAEDYPYENQEGSCKKDEYKKADLKLAGYRKIAKGNEVDLLDAIAQQPVAVGFDAHHSGFKLYKSGVFDVDYCTDHLTHALVIVGYGKTEDGKPYYKIKNSWGKLWGMGGYGHVVSGKNMCGIADLASYPVLKNPESWFENLKTSK